MSIETGVPLSELRDLTHHAEQLNRAVAGWIEFARKALDATETDVAAYCDHVRRLAQADSPVECVKLHTEFLKSSMASMQKQYAVGKKRRGRMTAPYGETVLRYSAL